MRFATWNVQRPTTGEQRARLLGWIERINADVWVLTDTHMRLRPSGKHESVQTTASDRPQQDGEAWAAIWSRYPMRALAATSDPARAVAALLSLPTGDELIVYATVLPPVGSEWGTPPSAVNAFSRALDTQRADWMRLRQEFPMAEFCIAGAFNQDMAAAHFYGSAHNRDLVESALIDAQSSCVTQGSDDPIFAQTGGTHAAIDHIAVSADLFERVSGRGSWPAGTEPLTEVSDHFGLYVDFE